MSVQKGWLSGNYEKNLVDFNYKFATSPFDIIKKIEKLTGLDANITLIG